MHGESDAPRGRVLRLLRRYGWNATSFQTLEDGFSYWFDGQDACVPHVDTGAAWVAAGAPLAAPERLVDVAERFSAAAAQHGRRAVFFGIEARLAHTGRLHSQLIGEQPVWDPIRWPAIVERNASLRRQLQRARNKGVQVEPVSASRVVGACPRLRQAIDRLIAAWLATRPMAPMGFLAEVQPFSFAEERRYFVASRADEVVGFLAAVPVYGRSGWLFEDLIRAPQAPNGTAELLVDTAMRASAAAGSRYATLGLTPLAGPVSGWLAVARQLTQPLYDFGGLAAFRRRLRPARRDPIFLAVAGRKDLRGLDSAVAIVDALRAFARGRTMGFGLATLLRNRRAFGA